MGGRESRGASGRERRARCRGHAGRACRVHQCGSQRTRPGIGAVLRHDGSYRRHALAERIRTRAGRRDLQGHKTVGRDVLRRKRGWVEMDGIRRPARGDQTRGNHGLVESASRGKPVEPPRVWLDGDHEVLRLQVAHPLDRASQSDRGRGVSAAAECCWTRVGRSNPTEIAMRMEDVQ